METLLMILMFLAAVFLILLVLVQRGRGGGLAGALGGMGGQSAFGTKAGDLFTRVTIVAAGVWIVLCIFTVKWVARSDNPLTGFQGKSTAPVTAPLNGGGTDAAADSSTQEGAATTPPVEAPDANTPATSETPATTPGDQPADGAAAEKTE